MLKSLRALAKLQSSCRWGYDYSRKENWIPLFAVAERSFHKQLGGSTNHSAMILPVQAGR
jgi:hypothetical protein